MRAVLGRGSQKWVTVWEEEDVWKSVDETESTNRRIQNKQKLASVYEVFTSFSPHFHLAFCEVFTSLSSHFCQLSWPLFKTGESRQGLTFNL